MNGMREKGREKGREKAREKAREKGREEEGGRREGGSLPRRGTAEGERNC